MGTTTVPPCVRCGTPDGYIPPGRCRPSRGDLTRFGYPGLGCRTCFNTLAARHGTGRDDDASEPEPTPIDRKELRQRVKRVRVAKRLKARRGEDPDLTPDELDAVLPPVDCERTRVRLRRRELDTVLEVTG